MKQMLKVAIVGRPNIGKSTLFNALTRRREALVADEPGLTRDRHYGIAEHDGCCWLLVDTGGMAFNSGTLDQQILHQTRFAIDEADLVCFCVCAREGLTPLDSIIAAELRRSGKPLWLLICKVDHEDENIAVSEFASLGIGTSFCTAARRGRGLNRLREAFAGEAKTAGAISRESEDSVHIAFLGRPNVGKSTLINRIVGQERLLTAAISGTTRDSIRVPFVRRNRRFVLVDTAGVKRRKAVESLEKLSILKALENALAADVVALVCDAGEGITDQDASLAAQALTAGCALVVSLNKSDLINEENKDHLRRSMDLKLRFLRRIDTVFLSAVSGKGIDALFKAVVRAWRSSYIDVSTPKCTRLLQQAVSRHQPPRISSGPVKLRFAHQGGVRPPRIIVYGNRVDKLSQDYRRYLENFFREQLHLVGTPLAVEFRRTRNPYHDVSS